MSRLRRLAIAMAGVAITVVAVPSQASAHAALEASSPAPNSVLEEAPAAIVLDFDEPVDADVSTIEVFDQDRSPVEVGEVRPAGDRSIITADLPDLDDGLYAVRWRVTSADGHVVDGAFAFQIGTAPAGDADELLDDIAAGASPAVDTAIGAARFLAYLGIIALAGVGLLGLEPGSPGRSRRIAWTGVVLAVVGALGTFALYGAQIAGGGLADVFDPARWADVAATRTGRALLVRILLLGGIAALLWRWDRRQSGGWRSLGAVLLAGVAVTHAVAGHASAARPSAFYVANDALHLLAISVWVGGLVMLAAGGSGWFAQPSSLALVRRFSGAALVAVPVMVFTGVVQAVELAGGLDDLTATRWGKILLVKVIVVVVLVVLGGIARYLLRHDDVAAVRRSVLVEAFIGIVVVALAAALVAQPPRPTVGGEAVSTTITAGGVIADVTITPAAVGANELHMVFTPPGGNLEPVAGLTARLSAPDQGIPPIPVDVIEEGTNHYSGTVTLPEGGAWRLELVVSLAPSSSVLLATTVDIAG